ncbi:MAG: lambda-exonuclease family protein [Paraclostridium sp.]
MTNKTVKELREIAKERGLKGFSKLKKDELAELLREPTRVEKFELTIPEDVETIQYKNGDEWLETRKLGIGGSDVAGILGESKYKAPIDVWNDKINGSTFKGNRYTRWGHNLEQPVALEFQALHNSYEVFEYNKTFKKGKSLANVDRLLYDLSTGEYGVLEIKTANFFGSKDWSGETIPQEYYCQVMHYLAVTGLKFAWIACLVGGNDYKEFYIERNDEECQFILNSCEEFWNDFIETKLAPPLDGTSNYTDYQKHKMLHVDDVDVEIEFLDDKVETYKDIQKQIKELEIKSELIKQELTQALLDNGANKSKTEKNSIRIMTQNRKSLDKKAFENAFPDLVKDYKEKEEAFKFEKPVSFLKIN